MKNTLYFLCIIFLLLQTAAHCQRNFPPEATKINYVARIPVDVMKYRPKTAITRFFGLTEIQGKKLALHFYDLEPVQKIDAGHATRNSYFDVFSVQNRGKQPTYKRMHHVALARFFWPLREQKIICEMLKCWLDPNLKTKPILMLRISVRSNSLYYHDNLLTFNDGLQKQPIISEFGGSFVELGWNGWRTDYNRGLDKNGFLMPWQIDTQDSIETYCVYKWDDQTFKEIARQPDETNDSLIYHWDGEKFIEGDLNKTLRNTAPAEK